MKKTILILAFLVGLSVITAPPLDASTSINSFNALYLYMYKGQAQSYVGYPDSVEYNNNYRRNLDFYATPDGYDVYRMFIGYMANGQIGVLGNIYRPGRTTLMALANQLRAKGLTQIASDGRSFLFQGNDLRTGRLMYAIVEDWTSSGMGPVLTLLTEEVYRQVM
ncbi:MAG TPA: hypothetical protein ENN89_04865 [Synergistetes bacterium]|nr:hypothetical protein [Synergistota bacterium]